MVPDPELSKDLTGEASQVIASLEDFEPQLWHLPAFSTR